MSTTNGTSKRKWAFTVLRCAIGWHFLYEGVTKALSGHWTAKGYLENAWGPLAGLYHLMASSAPVMTVVDAMNLYGLILIGLALFIGVAIRRAAILGIAMLTLYYLAYPPFGGEPYATTEGSLFLVNRNVIEALGLALLLFSNETGYGLHGLAALFAKKKAASEDGLPANSRREALKNLAALPVLGVLGYGAAKSYRGNGVDGISGATRKLATLDITKLAGELPKGRIGKFEISRLVMGGNMISGCTHSRDLHYVSDLALAYNTNKKIFETLMLAESAGINAINICWESNELLREYKKITGSKLIVISQAEPNMKNNDYFTQIDKAIDCGADIIQILGGAIDHLTRDRNFDLIAKLMDRIRGQGYVAGMGAHAVDGLILCEEQGILPDYYMKTLHHDQYWSAHPVENRETLEVIGKCSPDHNKFHENLFCQFPEKDAAFVEKTKLPVMAFKVLAAGAIEPKDGFNWAFQHGADFICVGMYDFQVVSDVNTTLEVLANLNDRKRGWNG